MAAVISKKNGAIESLRTTGGEAINKVNSLIRMIRTRQRRIRIHLRFLQKAEKMKKKVLLKRTINQIQIKLGRVL
jgi:hypothetical protein